MQAPGFLSLRGGRLVCKLENPVVIDGKVTVRTIAAACRLATGGKREPAAVVSRLA